MGTKSLRLVPLTWRSIYNHRREFHPSNSYRVSFSLPGLPVTATTVGASSGTHSRLPSRGRSRGPVTARAGTRASDTRFTSSPTYPPGQNGKPGTGAPVRAQPALQGHPSTGDLPELGSPRGASDGVRVWRWRSAPQFLARHSPGGGLAGLSTVISLPFSRQ